MDIDKLPDSYLGIKNPSQGLYKEKASKFISFLYPIFSTQEAQEKLEDVRKKFYDARHVAYAYIIGFNKEIFRMSDDGEPSATAGRPIYGQLCSFGISNAILIVVRYFGGTKLGVGPLAQAYKTAAKDALDAAQIEELPILINVEIKSSYENLDAVMRFLKDAAACNINQNYSELNCITKASVRKAKLEALLAIEGIEVEIKEVV